MTSKPRNAAAAAGQDAANPAPGHKPTPGRKVLPPHLAKVGLVLQGGGALGAYQAGVYQGLYENGYQADWVAGVSIGAINGAIIAGNKPDERVDKLRAFWERITDGPAVPAKPLFDGDIMRGIFNEWSALASVASGVNGFYHPRMPPVMLQPWGTPGALSVYDTAPLRATLLDVVDFDLLNKGATRLSVGAANIRKGNSVYFDTCERTLGPEHIMASAALPPGFPPIEIEGEQYWDGGVVSNTPLQYVLDEKRDASILVFQVDLFSAAGVLRATSWTSTSARRISSIPRARGSIRTWRERSRRCGARWSGCSRSCPSSSRATPTCAISSRNSRAVRR